MSPSHVQHRSRVVPGVARAEVTVVPRERPEQLLDNGLILKGRLVRLVTARVGAGFPAISWAFGMYGSRHARSLRRPGGVDGGWVEPGGDGLSGPRLGSSVTSPRLH